MSELITHVAIRHGTTVDIGPIRGGHAGLISAIRSRYTPEELAGRPKLTLGEQGFMTNSGRFVDRQEAAEIATLAGQVRTTRSVVLFSEDLLVTGGGALKYGMLFAVLVVAPVALAATQPTLPVVGKITGVVSTGGGPCAAPNLCVHPDAICKPAIMVTGCADVVRVVSDTMKGIPCADCPPAAIVKTILEAPEWITGKQPPALAKKKRLQDERAWLQRTYGGICSGVPKPPSPPSTGKLDMELRDSEPGDGIDPGVRSR